MSTTRLAWRLLTVGLALTGLAGCAGLSGGNVTVRFQSEPSLSPQAPVESDDRPIGEVVAVGRETPRGSKRSAPTARLAVDAAHLDELRQGSVFIVEEDAGGRRLRLEQTDPSGPAKTGELVFLGFASYREYLAWRVAAVGSRKVDEVLRLLDDALRGLDRTPWPGPDPSYR